MRASLVAPALTTALAALVLSAGVAPAQEAAPAPAAPQSHLLEGGRAVAVARGERVVLQVAADGALTLVSTEAVGPAQLTAPAFTPGGGPLDPAWADAMKTHAAAGTLALTLGGSQASGSLLKVENGLDRHIGYRAGIVSVVGGQLKSAGTSVCSVPAHIASIEHWPQPIIRVVAGDFTERTGAPVCK